MTYALVLFARQLGGHELMSLKLASQMRLSGMDVVVFYPWGMSNVERLLDEYPEIPVERYGFKSGGNFAYSLLSRFKLACRLTRNGSFIVNCQGSFEQNFLFTIFSKLLLGRVISYVPYTSMPSERLAKLGRLRDFFQRPLAATADFIVVIHNCYKKDLTHRYRISADKVFVVENIAVTRNPHGDARLLRQKCHEQKIITFVMPGRIYFKQKGQDILLSALAALVSQDENVRLKFIGDGPDASRLENKILDEGMSRYAELVGWQSDSDKIYKSGDVVLLPSRYEGVSLVMLEAIQRGLPIVASDLPINEEFIFSEYLFKSGDYAGLAEKMFLIARRIRSGRWSKESNYLMLGDRTGENQRAIKNLDRAACRIN